VRAAAVTHATSFFVTRFTVTSVLQVMKSLFLAFSVKSLLEVKDMSYEIHCNIVN